MKNLFIAALLLIPGSFLYSQQADSANAYLSLDESVLDLPSFISEPNNVHRPFFFDRGDEILFDLQLLEKKGTINIAFFSYPENRMMYSKEKMSGVSDERIVIPKRGIYYFIFSNNHITGRRAHFSVRRKPGPESGSNFITGVNLNYDTTYQEVANNRVWVYPIGNPNHPNRSVVRLALPPNTAYWIYWIGVGQQSLDNYLQSTVHLCPVASGRGVDPIYALGHGMIRALPMIKAGAVVDYTFADSANSEKFYNGDGSFSHYYFKEGRSITSDYSIQTTKPRQLNLCILNNSQSLAYDVNIRLGAFIVQQYYTPVQE